MARKATFFLIAVLIVSSCFADTFTHRQSGKVLTGYATSKIKAGQKEIRTSDGKTQFIDLGEYEVCYNYMGRKNKVIIFSIKNALDLICEADAFEKAIVSAANQGPYFILIDIDSSWAETEIAQRFCAAIVKTTNCQTVAFIGGGKAGGVYGNAAIVALSCDSIFIAPTAFVGASQAFQEHSTGGSIAARLEWKKYSEALSEKRQINSLLMQALLNSETEVIEVERDSEKFLIDPLRKTRQYSQIQVISTKDEPLNLSASNAITYNFAEKTASSVEEILNVFDVGDAKQIRDRSILQARRSYEAAERMLKASLSSIETENKKLERIMERLNDIGSQIQRANAIIMQSNSTTKQGYQRHPKLELELRNLNEQYDESLVLALRGLRSVVGSYRKAIVASERHPDLAEYIDSLRKELQTAETAYNAKYNEAKLRSKAGY